jgi:hypothetical protein
MLKIPKLAVTSVKQPAGTEKVAVILREAKRRCNPERSEGPMYLFDAAKAC